MKDVLVKFYGQITLSVSGANGPLLFASYCTPLATKLQMNKHSLTISKIINGGYGLGQLENGRVAMVRHVLKGEQVTVIAEEEKKSYLLAKLLTVENCSDFRTTAPCPYFGVCGGCDLQHMAYDEQLRIKHDIVSDLLVRQFNNLGGDSSLCPVDPTLPSPITTAYRQRIRLWVKDGSRCGFRKFRSHEIIPIQRCLIAREEINEALAMLSTQVAFSRLLANTIELELLWNPSSAKVSALFHLTRKPRPADFTSGKELHGDIPLIERVFFSGEQFPLVAAAPANCDTRLQVIYDAIGCDTVPLTMGWEVGGFCQVNLEQNRNLIKLVYDLASVQQYETVLDLFCGSGNFSIPLAAAAGTVVGIEGQGAAIRSARANSTAAGLGNTTFHKRPIHLACEELTAAGECFDCLITDPPRQGIPGLAEQLYTLCRSRMIYISCDPATLCRDLADLHGAGFSVKRIQPVDMFPQTHHIETVVLLEKN